MTRMALDRDWQVAYVPTALAAHNVAPCQNETRLVFSAVAGGKALAKATANRSVAMWVSGSYATAAKGWYAACTKLLNTVIGLLKDLKIWPTPTAKSLI